MSRELIRKPLLVSALALLLLVAASHGVEAADKSASGLLDINVATMAEFEELPGIGPALARKIVEFRKQNGSFRTVDDLLKIRGIGEKSLARFRDRIVAGKSKKK
jgi:competence protein ComEA